MLQKMDSKFVVASEQEIVCLTSLDTADALLKVLESISFNILPL